MGDLYSIDGRKLTSEPVVERIVPQIPMDTEEGKFIVPVVLIAAGQYNQLVIDVAQRVADILCPTETEQLELPLEADKPE